MKAKFFIYQGAVNDVLNAFADFIIKRKSLSEYTEKQFVKKLDKLKGATNTPLSLLQQRIDNMEINYSVSPWSKQVITEMLEAIKKHSNP